MRTRRPIIIYLSALLWFLCAGRTWCGVDTRNLTMVSVTGFSYAAGPHENPETALALALFGAKYKAVAKSSDRLVDAGLLNEEPEQKRAIFCLVVDAMSFHLLEKSVDAARRTYTVKINSALTLADYVMAEIRNKTLQKEEMHLSLKEEMEPAVSAAIEPARELSRAYRYISNRHWRMAIIYMDYLETKYPHWGALHLAKATAYLGTNESERALSALTSACYLGVQEACLKMNALDPPD